MGVFNFLLSQVRTSTTALIGGQLYFYDAGTTTPRAVYLDAAQTIPATNPHQLDSNGTAQLYGYGLYRVVVKDASGVTRFDRDNISPDNSDEAIDSSGYATLVQADEAAVSSGRLLRISRSITLAASTTLYAKIEMVPPAMITIPSGATLTINSSFDAGLYQVLDCVGTGKVVFGPGAVKEVYPEWFGAMGDGVTDDTVAIQAALDSGNKIIIFTKNYTIANYLIISTPGTSITGADKTTGLTQTSGVKTGLVVTAANCVIDGMTFTGASSMVGATTTFPYVYNAAVTVLRADSCVVKNCVISTWGTGVYFSGARYSTAYGNIVDLCTNGINDDDYGYSTTSPASGTQASTGNVYANNVVSNSLATGIVVDFQGTESFGGNDPIGLEVATHPQSRGIRVTDNEVYGSQLSGGGFGNGITLDTARGCTVSGNYCHNNAANGILLFHQAYQNTVSGNICRNNGWSGVELTSDRASVPSQNTISANVCSYNSRHGLHMEVSSLCTITGNELVNNGQDGVFGQRYVSNCTFSGNTITGNRRNGLHLIDSFTIGVNNNSIVRNGYETDSTYCNILVEKSTLDYFGVRLIDNNHSQTSMGGTNSVPLYDIKFATNAASRLNAIIGAVSASIFDGATGTDYGSNINAATVTTLSGATAILAANGYNYFNIASVSPTTITSISGEDTVYLKVLYIEAFNGNTTIKNNTEIALKGATDVTLSLGQILTLRGNTSGWREVARNF